MLLKNIAWLLLVVLPLTRVATAWGEETPVDTTTIETGLIKKITPVYNHNIKGDASSLTMGNGFSNSIEFSNGLNMTTALRINETRYRDQDREDNTKDLSHTMTYMLRPGLIVNGVLSDYRMNNRIVSFTGALQDFIVNTKEATVGANYFTTTTKSLKMDSRAKVDLSTDEKNFKVDKTLGGSLGGGVRYYFGKRLSLKGRGYLSKSEETSEAGVFEYKGLGHSADSLQSVVSLQVTDSANVDFAYTRYNSTRETIDLPRGTFLQQDLEETDLIQERELRNSRVMEIKSTTKPIQNLSLTMNARHSEQTVDFAVEKRRSSRTVSDILNGKLTYTLDRQTRANIDLERKEILHDLGPQSVSSFDEKVQSARASFQHSFTPTFSLGMQASTTLIQQFYIDYDVNPRDRDQLNRGLSFNLSSSPFSKINTSITLSVSSIDFIHIDRSFSRDNRKETTYDLRPNISYRLNDRIEISQSYSLNIEFTDFVFTEDENFLDRNIMFSNDVKTMLSKNLQVNFYYGLHLHDGGSYLPATPGGERLLDISSEDRRDQMRISFRYWINEHLTMVGGQEYSQRVDRVVSTGRETKFTDGGFRGGLEGNYKWGETQEVTFKLIKINRFGRFNTKAQNDYWEMNSQVRYTF